MAQHYISSSHLGLLDARAQPAEAASPWCIRNFFFKENALHVHHSLLRRVCVGVLCPHQASMAILPPWHCRIIDPVATCQHLL